MEAKGAETTWALVVGIDTYKGGFRTLQGASLDAIHFYEWLKKLSVLDSNIRFHAEAAPDNQAAVAALTLPVHACTLEDIAQSLLWLQDGRGSKLFVFLAGHGLHESTYGRVFIAQDATPKRVQNLGLEWVGRYLQGLDYADQYLILDGCLNHPYPDNHKPELSPGTITGIEPGSRLDHVAQVFCAAARTGQLAEERGGRGAFTQEFLRAVDPDKPNPLCQEVDLTDGTIRINLNSVVDKIIRPTFTQLKLAQEPYASAEGDAPSPDSLVDLIPDDVATLCVRVDPPKATAGIERIALTSLTPAFRMDYPSSDVIAIPANIATVWPRGVTIDARCAPKSGFSSNPDGVQSRTLSSDAEMVFAVEETAHLAPPRAGVADVAGVQATIDFVGPNGVLLSDLSDDAVHRIAGAVSEHPEALSLMGVPPLDVHLDVNWPNGVIASGRPKPDLLGQLSIGHTAGDMGLHLYDWGASITCTPENTHLLETFGQAVAHLINTYALDPSDGRAGEPAHARVRLRPSVVPASLDELLEASYEAGAEEYDRQSRDHLSGVFIEVNDSSVARLVGFLWDEPVLAVGDVELSLREALQGPFVRLEPGPWLVSLTLPWGVWNTSVVVENTIVEVALPESVGRSPLRVTFLDRDRVPDVVGLFGRPVPPPAHAQALLANTVLTSGDKLAPYSASPVAQFLREPAPAPWRGSVWRSGMSKTGPTVRIDTARTTLETSLVGSGPVAMRVAPPYRAEPLSLTASPYWDTLIGAGRLESVNVGQVVAATWETWTEVPFGVAIAYACFAQNNNELLRQVLDSLEESASEAADLTFLRAALDWRKGTHDPGTAFRLQNMVGRVPWFQWGLNIGITAAEHYGVATLKAALQSVSRRSVPDSPWLIWEPNRELDEPDT